MVASETLAFLAMSEIVADWKPFSAKMLSAAFKILAPLRGFFSSLVFVFDGSV